MRNIPQRLKSQFSTGQLHLAQFFSMGEKLHTVAFGSFSALSSNGTTHTYAWFVDAEVCARLIKNAPPPTSAMLTLEPTAQPTNILRRRSSLTKHHLLPHKDSNPPPSPPREASSTERQLDEHHVTLSGAVMLRRAVAVPGPSAERGGQSPRCSSCLAAVSQLHPPGDGGTIGSCLVMIHLFCCFRLCDV